MSEETQKVWRVGAGTRLSGVAHVHGNKNAALPAMAAALLLPVGGTLELHHIPHISDVAAMGAILEYLGISWQWTGSQELSLTRVSDPIANLDVPAELTRRIRGSITLLGPLAGMYDRFRFSKPGGDKIGSRPIDAHISALADLGISVTNEPGFLATQRAVGTPLGGTVILTEQSVTATLMLLLYSGFLPPHEHLTLIDAACEPHIVTLCTILKSMGAHIDGIYSNLLSIRWPHGRHVPANPLCLDDDFMEATTYAIAAAITKSDLTIPFRNAAITLFLVNRYLEWMGIATKLERDQWTIYGSRSTFIIEPSLKNIKAEPWPRFPTDVMSMFVVLATQCSGTLKFIEYMYDDRFGFVQSLRDIGARIDTDGKHAIVVHGPTPLAGNELFLRPDIRSGAAMLLAALAASGTTVLHDRGSIIERGYQDLPETLAALGALLETIRVAF